MVHKFSILFEQFSALSKQRIHLNYRADNIFNADQSQYCLLALNEISVSKDGTWYLRLISAEIIIIMKLSTHLKQSPINKTGEGIASQQDSNVIWFNYSVDGSLCTDFNFWWPSWKQWKGKNVHLQVKVWFGGQYVLSGYHMLHPDNPCIAVVMMIFCHVKPWSEGAVPVRTELYGCLLFYNLMFPRLFHFSISNDLLFFSPYYSTSLSLLFIYP